MCGTVSSMLSGLETRSLGLNTLGTTCSPASTQSVQISRPSTAAWVQPVLSKVNLPCSRPQRNVHRPGFEPGTPWSEIRRPNHCATLLFDILQVLQVFHYKGTITRDTFTFFSKMNENKGKMSLYISKKADEIKHTCYGQTFDNGDKLGLLQPFLTNLYHL